MGLTADSTGIKAVDNGLVIQKEDPTDKVIALAGNPNVGKSTVFNELTGLKQHTGNWPGKTVTNAQGRYVHKDDGYVMVDIPGTYSLMAHSAEEEVARDFICFGNPDAVIVVCDATCLERNMNLVLQTIEIMSNVVVCVNLMDEAKKKNIQIDFKQLEENLGVPVVGTSARSRKGLDALMDRVSELTTGKKTVAHVHIRYNQPIEAAIALVEPVITEKLNGRLNPRWVALKLIDYDETLAGTLADYLGCSLLDDPLVVQKIDEARKHLAENGLTEDKLRDSIVSCIVLMAESVCGDAVCFENCNYNARDRKLDRIFTSKWTGIPVMLILLLAIFWITITGANYPSQMLSNGLFWLQDRLTEFFVWLGTPEWVHGALVLGVYRVLAWVVAVMLPPMAIFFPLFTLLEDSGYLPRVAFNLDKSFKKCCACGKQALTMCMGFGCNAAGIVGARIIDSPRERLIAIITNNFVPCNGRFPTLIAIITMFFVGTAGGVGRSLLSTLLLTGVVVLGVLMTFIISRLLSQTILKGIPSSFTLELPPYRRPQIGKVIVRSIFDRTLFVLGRAIAVAAPAGLIIWIMANVMIGDASLLSHCANFLDPFARLLGLDGVILMAFILGFPANEIVIPIIIMAYMATGSILELDNLSELKALLVNNGWTWLTAVCTMLFSLMHWPCSTTCLTIKKETQSLKWTAVSFLVPTVTGILVCFVFAGTMRLLGFA
ncbi:ferrous iron transport protein B [Hydrogenoanaerobacterium sp.]|uniref:ferrous iron transport protein B n=1 Tax=Hydrogenoanaerobacterium sp. TaxID=2953763 RepID=UPI00289A6660|nr:ferrous iron transport protein B [Hydrogenoanaerobacterium sp.]